MSFAGFSTVRVTPAPPSGFQLQLSPRLMLPKLLYDLEKSYFEGLNKHLHNENYVKQLIGLPEDELAELVDYLSDVCLPLTK